MQPTTTTWRSLWASGNARLEARVSIDGVTYDSEISAPVISRALMREGLKLGNVVSASCAFSIQTADSIPKSAAVAVEMRLTDGTTNSEWLPAGTFYISRRGKDETGRLALECYDALLKANAVWTPSSGGWPRSMTAVLAELAALLGLSVDARTSVTAYSMGEPEAGTSIRDALSRIGAANGGSWIVTPEGKLRLAPLRDGQTAAGEADAVTVQGVLRGFEYSGAAAVTGIRYYTDGAPVVLGDETGAVVDIGDDATAVQDLYTALAGIGYQAYSLSGAIYDPAAELGDGLRAGVNGEIRSQLLAETVTLGPLPQGEVSAPAAAELADEYPYIDGAANQALIAAKAYAQAVTDELDTSLNQQAIFNRLTNNGAAQGLYMLNGQLYVNASYIYAGTIDGSTVNAKLLNIVDANGNVIASFNSVITLGKATDAHAEMDFNSFDIYDNGGNLIFTAGDLRDANGRATVMDRLVGNGVGNTFNLTLTAISVTGVTIDGTPTSGWSLQNSGREIRFTSAPADGAEIKVTYVTEQPVYRYDIGIRLVNSLVGINSVASGYSIEASGAYSHAEGLFTKASGDAAHAEGDGTQASGTYSHAEGMLSKASGNAAHAEGNKTQASGTNSHAEGNNTEASGGYSHAEGYKSKASAFASHAEGEETQALGTCCHAEGCGTIASGFYQHVFGSYNEISAAYAEIVGNGTADNARANARTLDWSGNEWIAGALSVGDAAGTRGNLGITPANIGAVAKAGDTMTGQLNLKPPTGEGGQIQLGAATDAPSENGINIDNNHGVFRIFGQASADGTSKTGNGSFISFDPYLNRFRVLSGLSPGPALEINGDGTISVAYPANWRTALGAASVSDISAKIYSVRGEIVKSATTGTAVGVGKATVQVVGKTVIVDFEAKITTAGTLNNVYNIGIQVSNLRALNSDIPAFTVVNGGNIHYYTAGGVLDTGHEGYAGEASVNVSENYWSFGRMYTTTGSVGQWPDVIYTVGMYVTGTLLGALN